ncbi:hypothetical protein PEPNEM18_00509 [Aedoeadaptatus nemausensis]|uniref:Uncharacterized protein n=1 Tax=Aedoeadaptatus nemausensis TaxID=2582829 RepID=A0A6V6XZY5_9FIRM|nr:DUF1292 domain-containing protein [Peptoniphilus nemausensis]CAC9925312.1 hypothetical protein PEPNEM18_00509 [Peptoniphilus nemausensis]
MSHDHNHDHEHEHEEVEVITLTLEDDSELECAVIGIFPFEEKEYIALMPLDGDDIDEDASVLLYEYNEIGDDDLELVFIEDEDYFNKVADEFEALYADEGEE